MSGDSPARNRAEMGVGAKVAAAIRAVGFDADDTLWMNMPLFTRSEARFCEILSPFADAETVSREQYRTESANMRLYGFGTKSYTLSMFETALRLGGDALPHGAFLEILELGKGILEHPPELLDGVAEVLSLMRDRFRLVVATKGDLLEQERKLDASGLREFFHHVEIMSDKTEAGYAGLIRRLGVAPAEFLMVGNSVKSDIAPVLAVGGYAAHIPYHDTWVHEAGEPPREHPRFFGLDSIRDLPGLPILRDE